MSIDLSRIAQGHRKVLIKVNGAGVEKILSSYNKVKNDPEYVGRNKEVIPDGIEYTGVIATNTFKVTGTDLSTKLNKYLVSYNPADWATTANKQNYALDIQKITTAAYTVDTTLTVANNIPTGYTKAIILDSDFIELFGITDHNFAPTANDVGANTNATGRAVVNNKGLLTLDVTGISGLYSDLIPAQHQLRMGALPSGKSQLVRITTGLKAEEMYFEGAYGVKQASDGGANDGNTNQSLAVDLQYKSGGRYMKFITDNDFSTAVELETI